MSKSQRQKWMAVLARADTESLERHWQAVNPKPAVQTLRQPETGLVMLRGRAGGDGQQFNMGEMTVTRCAVRLVQSDVAVEGHAYIKGRDRQHAELAARFDAMLQINIYHDEIMAGVVGPLAEVQASKRKQVARKAAATKVDFFTMVRGDGGPT